MGFSFNTTCQPLTPKNYLLKIKMKTLIGLPFMALAVSMCSATEQSSLEAIKAELKEEMKAEMRDELRKIQDRIAEDMEQRIETPFAIYDQKFNQKIDELKTKKKVIFSARTSGDNDEDYIGQLT